MYKVLDTYIVSVIFELIDIQFHFGKVVKGGTCFSLQHGQYMQTSWIFKYIVISNKVVEQAVYMAQDAGSSPTSVDFCK